MPVAVMEAESVAVSLAESVAVTSVPEVDAEVSVVELGVAEDEMGLGTFLPVQTKSRLTAVVMLPFM